VGLVIDKGVEQMAAMLGVLKAGKFFVLFDPSFPLVRNSAILEDTSPRLILVDAKNTPYASKLTNTTSSLIAFESIDPKSVCDDLKIEISPNSFAYVVYIGFNRKAKRDDSESSEQLHFVMIYSKMLNLTPNDRCILLTSGTANTIANSLLLCLLNGAALHPFNVNELGLSRLTAYLSEENNHLPNKRAVVRKLCESLSGNEDFRPSRSASRAGVL
jgi:non-ribosomal peptide synthetase component F